MEQRFIAHPWHGVDLHPQMPELVIAFIEITPLDGVKYEIDKKSGLLKIDRPQLYSNYVPALYGFIPQTYCGTGVAKLANEGLEGQVVKGDHDPLDILVLTEKTIAQGNILVNARPIGGLKMIDKQEADDKIIAILEGDRLFGEIRELKDLPEPLLDRIVHYFLTYKQIPGRDSTAVVEISSIYDREAAQRVIQTSVTDYEAEIRLR